MYGPKNLAPSRIDSATGHISDISHYLFNSQAGTLQTVPKCMTKGVDIFLAKLREIIGKGHQNVPKSRGKGHMYASKTTVDVHKQS